MSGVHMPSETIALIPAYNERVTIGSIVLEALDQVDKVVVIDDGSTDDTAHMARRAGAEVIRLEINGGKAAALREGFKFAVARGFDAGVILDADGQHNPQEIPRILEPVLEGEADLTIGSRFLKDGYEAPLHRKFGQRLLNFISNLGMKKKLTDTQSGFRALSRKAMENMEFESRNYNIESDMIVGLSERGLSIKEIPISVNYDVPKRSNDNAFSHGISVFNRGVSLLSQRRPLLLMGVPGFTLFVIGTFLGMASMLNFTVFEWTWLFQTLSAVFLFTIGLVLSITALVLNSIADLFSRLVPNGGR